MGANSCAFKRLTSWWYSCERWSARGFPAQKQRLPCAVPTLRSLSCSYVIFQTWALYEFFLFPKILFLETPPMRP